MEISLAYILIAAEVILILIGISVTLAILLLRKPLVDGNKDEPIEENNKSLEDENNELDAINLDESYIDFLEQAIERNEKKVEQQESIENDISNESQQDDSEYNDSDSDNNTSPAPNETQNQLLKIRKQFLLLEKTAAENTEHEIHFWDSLYDGMKNILDQFSFVDNTTTKTIENNNEKTTEKVFYIETQGKKIDGEVNKLKDIIYEQENALSSMKKAMNNAESELPEESESLNVLKEQIEAIERQLNDSKMCMDVLEMENNRLQEEVDKMTDIEIPKNDNESTSDNSESMIDIDEMKGMVEEQKNKIEELIKMIESLELTQVETDKLKSTINDFTRTSQEMMGCISILEEENERLKADEENDTQSEIDEFLEESSTDNNADIELLKTSISKLEEEAIKKDVAYAQLQDEFSSMETEYLAMYEAMHGDNS